MQAAQSPHNFLYRGCDVTTDGNPLAHSILRGGVDKYGTCVPNYHYEDLVRLLELYEKRDLQYPAAIIDANHSNSNKQFREQVRIVSEVLHSRRYHPGLRSAGQRRDDRELSGRGEPAHYRAPDLWQVHHGPLPGLAGNRAPAL